MKTYKIFFESKQRKNFICCYVMLANSAVEAFREFEKNYYEVVITDIVNLNEDIK